MLVRSEEKIMYQTSAGFHEIVLITWVIRTDTRRSKNIQKNIKFVWELKLRKRWINKILRNRNVY